MSTTERALDTRNSSGASESCTSAINGPPSNGAACLRRPFRWIASEQGVDDGD